MTKRRMTLFHCTTPRKLDRYKASGRILVPVRGFDTREAATEWCRKTGRSVVLELEGADCHKLPDHHNEHGRAWWCDADVETWTIVAGGEHG